MADKIDIVTKIYKINDDIVFSFIMPAIFSITLISIIIGLYIKAELLESKLNWSTNMCVPKYMFVSGFINHKPGEHALSATYDNFKQCVTRFKNTPKTK